MCLPQPLVCGEQVCENSPGLDNLETALHSGKVAEPLLSQCSVHAPWERSSSWPCSELFSRACVLHRTAQACDQLLTDHQKSTALCAFTIEHPGLSHPITHLPIYDLLQGLGHVPCPATVDVCACLPQGSLLPSDRKPFQCGWGWARVVGIQGSRTLSYPSF